MTIEFLLLKDGKYQVELTSGPVDTSPRLPEVSIDTAAFWEEVRGLSPG